MPAKTKKKPTASRPRSTVSNSRNIGSTRTLNKKYSFIIIAVLAVIGAFLLFRASAATTNFEAEAGTRNSLVSAPVADTTASGGQYVAFAQPITTTTGGSTQRFPGDPNPKVTGKAYWGANVSALLADGSITTDVNKRHEIPSGKSLAVNHSYFNCGSLGCDTSGAVNKAKADHAANRLPWLTFKMNNWRDASNGLQDSQMNTFLSSLDALGKPVWVTLFHEPNDNVDGSTRTAATFVGMNQRFRQRMNAANNGSGTKNIGFMPHFSDWAFSKANSSRNPEAWFAKDTWDAMTFSNYCQSLLPDRRGCRDNGGNTFDTQARLDSIAFIESKGLPWGVGEWSLSEKRTGPLEMTQYFKKYWEWGFINNKDAIVYSYFDADASRPNPDSVYYSSLRDANLDEFHRIMNDPRVMRINNLSSTSSTSPSTTNYGRITSSVNLPDNGAYKVWVRMKAGSATNNSAQIQIDNATVSTIGGATVSTTNWTWVSLPSVNLSSGSRLVTITGTQGGVKIDRVIVTSELCTPAPTGNGDDCAVVNPQPPVAPTVTVSGITNGQTISGTVKVSVTSTKAIESVAFRPDDVWAATENLAPYEFSWDTTKYSNGTHTMVTRTRSIDDIGDAYTSNIVSVNINNGTTTTSPPPVTTDTLPPSKPTNLRAALTFDWVKMKYVMKLNWSASYDNVGVTGYQVSRGTTLLGKTTKLAYTDSNNLVSGASYTYKVVATDAVGLKSLPASITMTTQCVLLSCTATVF